MGVITLTLAVSRHLNLSAGVPLWVIPDSAAAMALGTSSGGWRIKRTVGRRIYALTPVSEFAAETLAAGILLVAPHVGLIAAAVGRSCTRLRADRSPRPAYGDWLPGG